MRNRLKPAISWPVLIGLLLILLLLQVRDCYAQNYRSDGVVQARSGVPAPGALVAVCSQPCTVPSNVSISTPPSPLAALCSSSSDVACVSPNPVTADGLGNYHFYVKPGRYSVVFYGSGLTASTQTDQVFPCDPSNCTVSSLSAAVVTAGNIDNIRYIDGVKFAKTAAGINAADADCVSGTPCLIMAPFSGTYSDATITLTKNHFLEFVGGGTFTVAGIKVPDSTTDTTAASGIDCPQHATIKLANAANADLVSDTNFLTLSGSGNTFGTFGFTTRGCIFDANKTNQTALVTSSTGTPSTVARSAGGTATIVLTGATSPAIAVGQTCNVSGITNDNSNFNGRYIAQAGTTSSQLVFFQANQGKGTIASVAATTGAPYPSMSVICYSGANGIRIYGRNNKFEDMTIANAVLDGLWTEGLTPGVFTDQTSELDNTLRSVRLINSGGDGWVMWGPQSTKSWDMSTFNHGQWGREVFSPLFDVNTISFLNGSGGLHLFAQIQQTGAQETAATGWGILVDPPTGPSTFSSNYASANGGIGFEARTQGHIYQGLIGNSVTGLKLNGGGGVFDIVTFNNSGNTFDCTSVVGKTQVKGVTTDTVGTLANANCSVGGFALGAFNHVNFIRPSVTAAFSLPATCIYVSTNGFTPCFPASNGTLAAPDVTTNFTAIQRFTGNQARLTSDFASANASGLQAITGLTIALPNAGNNFNFHCSLMYSQATPSASDQFGVASLTTAPTNLVAWSNTITNATTIQYGTSGNIASTTPTAIVTFTPAVSTVLGATIDGTIQIAGIGANSLQFYVTNGTAANVIVIKQGSWCAAN